MDNYKGTSEGKESHEKYLSQASEDEIAEGKGGDENLAETVDLKSESQDTLSRNNPISQFLREQKGKLNGVSEEEFMSKFAAHMKETGANPKDREIERSRLKRPGLNTPDYGRASSRSLRRLGRGGQVEKIVLKFTTLSETSAEAPSFTITSKGASIGRDPANEVSVPSDARLAAQDHSFIEYSDGSFYLVDAGCSFGASIRITVTLNKRKQWIIENGSQFSAGNSVFRSFGPQEDGNLLIEVLEGPLKGERKIINKKGATLGRSSDNIISVPDRELSRRHSKVEYDDETGQYYVYDSGSTNGTYMQLVGPYSGRYKLSLNDHILVGRTGFSINRYDYGLSEEMGHRQAMEDSCAIVQHLGISTLNSLLLTPQSFFGVFDGHGGHHASAYLAQHLHVNVAESLASVATELIHVIEEIEADSTDETDSGKDDSPCGENIHINNNNEYKYNGHSNNIMDPTGMSLKQALDDIVVKTLKSCYMKTDANFIATSEHPQNGSTATTALVLGQRLYCANVGDSRTLLCRNFQPLLLSQDHKPSREDEAKRIRDAGGFVINNRVMGELAVSRAFGDAEFKKGIQTVIEEEGLKLPAASDGEARNWDQPLITAEPDIQATTITDRDQFLLLACDGLFDVFTPEDVVQFVRANIETHGDVQKCCQSLTREAIHKRNSRDNVSVILIILNKWF
eukprot:gene2450-4758_t